MSKLVYRPATARAAELRARQEIECWRLTTKDAYWDTKYFEKWRFKSKPKKLKARSAKKAVKRRRTNVR